MPINNIHPTPLIEQLKTQYPNQLIVTDAYIAMYCEDVDQTIVIPGHFSGVSYAGAKDIFDENWKRITA